MDEQINNNLTSQVDTGEVVPPMTPTMQAMEYHEIAELFTKDGNYEKAEEYYLAEKNIIESMYRENPQDNFLDLINFYNNIGSFYQIADKYKEAEQYFVYTFNKIQEKNQQEPNTYKNELALPLTNLGLLYLETDHLDKAQDKINQAIMIRESIPKKNIEVNSLLAYDYMILGDINFHLNKLNDAELNYLKALEILRIIYPENKEILKPRLSSLYLDLADLYEKKGDQDEVKRYTELANL